MDLVKRAPAESARFARGPGLGLCHGGNRADKRWPPGLCALIHKPNDVELCAIVDQLFHPSSLATTDKTPKMTHSRPVCLYEDDALLVLLEPAGLLCVPGEGPDKQDCLSARAQAPWPDALVVHRLDMATSGLVAAGAQQRPRRRKLRPKLCQRRVHNATAPSRTAHVTTKGWQQIDAPLRAIGSSAPANRRSPGQGKPSQTRYCRGPRPATGMPGAVAPGCGWSP